MHARLEAARARLEAALAGAPACLLPPYTAYPARLAPLATSTDAPLEAAGGRRRVRWRTVSVCRRRRTPALLVVLMVG